MGRGDGPFLFLVLSIYAWIPAAHALPPRAKRPLTVALTSWLKTTSSLSYSARKPRSGPWLLPFFNCFHFRHQKILLALHTEAVKHLTPVTSLLAPPSWELSPSLTWITAVPFTWSPASTLVPIILRTATRGSLLASMSHRITFHSKPYNAPHSFTVKAHMLKMASKTHMLWPLSPLWPSLSLVSTRSLCSSQPGSCPRAFVVTCCSLSWDDFLRSLHGSLLLPLS